MKITFISMRKYKMCLGWKYRLKHFISTDKSWSGKIIRIMFLCEYGIRIDLRNDGFKLIDLLTDKEKHKLKNHNYLPGFINQFDPEVGELDENNWTAREFLKWLELNKFKITKHE
jgi:hypothetical protein